MLLRYAEHQDYKRLALLKKIRGSIIKVLRKHKSKRLTRGFSFQFNNVKIPEITLRFQVSFSELQFFAWEPKKRRLALGLDRRHKPPMTQPPDSMPFLPQGGVMAPAYKATVRAWENEVRQKHVDWAIASMGDPSVLHEISHLLDFDVSGGQHHEMGGSTRIPGGPKYYNEDTEMSAHFTDGVAYLESQGDLRGLSFQEFFALWQKRLGTSRFYSYLTPKNRKKILRRLRNLYDKMVLSKRVASRFLRV